MNGVEGALAKGLNRCHSDGEGKEVIGNWNGGRQQGELARE